MLSKWKNLHYAWKIVIACILLKLGVEGAVAVCMGSFITPIVNELGCKVSELTLYTSITAISMALFYTTAAKVVTKKKIGLILGIAVVIEVVSVGLMATFKNVHLFYITGVTIGVSQAFTGFVALPIIINMWFKVKNGTVLGIVAAVGSAASLIYTYLSASLIAGIGWRSAYLTLAIIAFIISVPSTFLLLRRPEEVGVEPYGSDQEEIIQAVSNQNNEFSLTKKEAFKLPIIYIAWLACILISYGCGVPYYINTFSTMELGQSITFGATAQICLMLGTMLSSIIVGRINDKFGVIAGLGWGAVTTTAGFAVMFLSFGKPFFALVSAFIVGLGNSMYTVQCPLLGRSIVGSKNYSEIWSIMMIANSLIGGGLFSTIGLFYDNFGTYRGAFIMSSCLFIAAFFLGVFVIHKSNQMKKAYAAKA